MKARASSERDRLAALAEYEILDTPPEDSFDDLTALAAQICEAPIALITIVGKERQWFKSRIGIDAEETARDVSFCTHALKERDLFIVRDARLDDRFSSNPLVTGEPHFRFYAGSPLVNDEGHALGALCVLDSVPRELTGSQARALRILSRLVLAQLELRRSDLQRRKAEAALRNSHKELQRCIKDNTRQLEAARREAESARSDITEVMERVSDGILAMDNEWRYTYLNPAGAAMLERSAEELMGKCAWVEAPHAIGGAYYQACHRAVLEQRAIDHQEYFPRIGRWLAGRIYPSKKGVSVVFKDITERVVRERELEDAHLQLQLTLRSSSIGLWDWNLATNQVSYSAEWKAQLGYAESEMSDSFEEWRSRIHSEDRPGILSYLEGYLAHPTPEFQHECRLRHKDGSYRFILTRARLYRHEETGKPLRLLGCHIDVTDRRKMEQSLLQSREQLRALAVHLQSVREEEAKRIARELHDEMGAALTGLKMDLFWIERQLAQPAGPGTQHALTERIKSTMELVDSTIRNVRKLCRELRPAVLDQLGLATAIEWQASEFQSRTGIECDVARCVDLSIDPVRATAVFRIFQEVLTNVARHAEATKVWTILETRAGMLTLTVADNGRGMAETVSGTRLGLMGMRERAFGVGGSLEISSTPGEGTTVCVRIPVEGAQSQVPLS